MKWLIILGSICAGTGFLWAFARQIPERKVVTLDERLSPACQDLLVGQYSQPVMQHAPHIADGVAHCTVQTLPLQTTHISCQAPRPLTLLNDQSVITHEGALISKDLFKQAVIDALPRMALSEQCNYEKNRAEIGQLARHLTPDLSSQYAITWVQPSTVLWADYAMAGLTVITRADQIVSEHQRKKTQQIYEQLCGGNGEKSGVSSLLSKRNGITTAQSATLGKMGQKSVVIDLRFNRHYIVKLGSGGSNGSVIG